MGSSWCQTLRHPLTQSLARLVVGLNPGPAGYQGARKAQREGRSGLWSFFDRVNMLGVEGEIILDRRDGSVWGLITPHSIDRTLAAERNAEVGGVPLVGQ